ncbi:MAG TPA: NAD(P)/FAD-dependent oxidoreductase [Casimicrobiaceae bacterium]|jgi:flavin-dependent dehydrogenase
MSSVPQSCDVVVIGGGPAGSLAATYLTAKGYSVALFERQKHPRYAVGESLLPDVWKYCDAAGVTDAIAGEGFLRKAGGSVDWNGEMRRLSFSDFGYTRPALHVERDRFDHILLERARASGAWIGEEIAVLDADFSRAEEDECEVSVSYRPVGENTASRIRCRYVLDASGQNGVIGRRLGLRVFDEAFRFMSVWGYFDDSKYIAADGKIYSAQSVREKPPTTYVSALPQGDGWAWLWHIMLRKTTSIGLVIPIAWAQQSKASGESWEAWYLRQCEAIPLLQRLLAEATFGKGSVRLVRNYSYKSKRIAGPGFLLLGDAAGFVDPIFSVGVVFAMYSAYAAAHTIDRCLSQRARRDHHRSIFSSQMQARLELSRSLAVPYYQEHDSGHAQARQAMAFSSMQAQALMYAASKLTDRSGNFDSMADSAEAHRAANERIRPLENPLK